jgi:iron complex transport system substrate-binding protein
MRVVSLLPSATELLYALDVEPVGVSHSCDYPPAARGRPTLTDTSVEYDTDHSPASIDEQVAAVDGPTYDLDRETLRHLDPDLVVTQGTCEVCAVESDAVITAVESLDLDCDVLTLDPHSLEEVLADVTRVGEAVGRSAAARDLEAALRRRVERVEEAVTTAEAGGVTRPTALLLDWPDPVFVGGHWVPDLLRAGGAEAVVHDDGASRRVRWRDVRDADPDRLFVAPCGFPLERTLDSLDDLRNRPGWDDLSAVRGGEVFALDGNGYVNRPGPRLVDSLEAIAGCLHPDLFDTPAPDVVARVGRDRLSA